MVGWHSGDQGGMTGANDATMQPLMELQYRRGLGHCGRRRWCG